MSEHDPTTPPSAATEPVEFDPGLLAAEIDRLRGDVGEIITTLAGPDGQGGGLVAHVTEHGKTLEELLGMLSGTSGGPWHYGKLSPDKRRALYLELGGWVTWLEGRYLVNLPSSGYELPACWFRHPVAVELLTALMVAHRSAYSTKAVLPSFTLVEWHVRALEPVFVLLRGMQVFQRCAAEHVEPTRPARHDAAAYAAWVDQDGATPDGAGRSREPS